MLVLRRMDRIAYRIAEEMERRHEIGGRLMSRAENFHQSVRRRERAWIGFKHPGSTQRFPAVHATVDNVFNVQQADGLNLPPLKTLYIRKMNRRPYHGMNVPVLILQGFSDPRWGTFNQIKAKGGQVRKGE